MKKSHFNFERGEKVVIEISDLASQRTKDRIREHGPSFVLFQTLNAWLDPLEQGIDPCVVVGSLSTGWDGWLPVNEINIDKE